MYLYNLNSFNLLNLYNACNISIWQLCCQAVCDFPTKGWGPFPSQNSPNTFHFGRIYDYLVESAPQYAPEFLHDTVQEMDSEDELELSVGPNSKLTTNDFLSLVIR